MGSFPKRIIIHVGFGEGLVCWLRRGLGGQISRNVESIINLELT